MKERIKEVVEREYGTVRRTRSIIKLEKLEKTVMGSFEYPSDYSDIAGGLTAFISAIENLVDEGYLKPISKKSKYKHTYLELSYWLTETASSLQGWNEAAMLRLMDVKVLNLDYYRNHPEAQTADVWEYIERVYYFLRTAAERQVITREERSLELFDREKFLSQWEGSQFLSRLGIKLEMLKVRIVREYFEYYKVPKQPAHIILITENHSFYDSAKRLMMNNQPVCGLLPDMLIYGEGWKIVSSLDFLQEQVENPLEAEILYAGDMDKKGWEIYGTLKFRYPELDLKLALPVYSYLNSEARRPYDYVKKQNDCPPLHLERVRQEAAAVPGLVQRIDSLLEMDKRIPQEVLNYEVMARLARG